MKNTVLRRFILGFFVIAELFMVSACSSIPIKTEKEETVDRMSEQKNAPESEAALDIADEGEQMEAETSELPDESGFCGQWILAGYEDDFGDRYYIAEDEGVDSRLSIYAKEGGLYADYHFFQYMSEDIYGISVIMEQENSSDMASDQPQSAVLKGSWDESISRRVSLLDKNELLFCETHYEMESEYTVYYTYFREGSEELENAAERRYRETVTVTDIEGLASAIRSRTKIILKEGIYNFSELDERSIQNPNIDKIENGDMDAEYVITGVTDLCLEAEEGADVTICIELASAKVFSFEACQNIILRGLTCGHEVAPGYCTGSVIYAYDSDNLTIESCRLYGSGTYGVETQNVWGLTVEDTEIYDCTYGLVSLSLTANAVFADCRLSDSQGFSMFEICNCSNICFETCEITGNIVDSIYYSFINSNDSWDVVFRDCVFKGNTYATLVNEVDTSENDTVVFDNCSVDGKRL